MVVSAHYAICKFAQCSVRKFSRIRRVDDLTAYQEDVWTAENYADVSRQFTWRLSRNFTVTLKIANKRLTFIEFLNLQVFFTQIIKTVLESRRNLIIRAYDEIDTRFVTKTIEEENSSVHNLCFKKSF